MKTKMKQPILIILVLLCTVALTFNSIEAGKAPVLERIVKTGEMRVGLSGNQPPFNAKSRTGEFMGLEVDLARMLAAAFGVKAKFVAKPFPELLDALNSGEVDMVMSGMAITAERSLKVAFVGPYMLSGKSILTKSTTLAAATDAEDLNKSDIKLAALANSTSQEFCEKVLPEAELVTTKDYDLAVHLILTDEVDALVADMPICVITVLRYPEKGLVTLVEPITIEPVGIALSPDDPQLHSLIQNYLNAFEGTGLMEQLRKKWLEDGSWIAALP